MDGKTGVTMHQKTIEEECRREKDYEGDMEGSGTLHNFSWPQYDTP